MGLLRAIAPVLPAAALALSLACSSGDLTSASSALVEAQRQANLSRISLAGNWRGTLTAADGISRESFTLIFAESEDFGLDSSLLVGHDIRLGAGLGKDTFALVNGLFQEGRLRFNLAPRGSSELVLMGGAPVLFDGELTENSFMSGEFHSGPVLAGSWEARLVQSGSGGRTPR